MEGVVHGCYQGGIFAMQCRGGGKRVLRHAVCRNKFGREGSTHVSGTRVVPDCRKARDADLVTQLGTHRYRCYKRRSGLEVIRIHGLESLGNGRR